MACVGEEGLARYLAGDLAYERHLQVEAHLGGCAVCAEILEELTMRTEIRAVGGGGVEQGSSDKLLWLERHYRLQIGDVVDSKYRIEKVIGQGGMGIVVRATHLALRENVALKFMHPTMADNPSHAARFVREARAAVRLRDEHVARVLDLGDLVDTGPFIVMEHLDGIDLLEHLKRHAPLSVIEAIDLCRQAASGVAAAHDAGIVHRDLKPGNLFLTDKRGRQVLKVLDFGVSKYLEGDSLAVTGTHMVVGSPMYMAPELFATARNASPASDVWALGVIFYRMLTGRLPFFGETLPELVAKVHFGNPTPVTHWRPELPREICLVLETCLARDPALRFANARALLGALDNLASAPSPSTVPPSPTDSLELVTLQDMPGTSSGEHPHPASPPNRSWVSATIGAAAASLIFGAILLATMGGDDREPAPVAAPAPAIIDAAAAPTAVSPDADAPEITVDAAVEPARQRRRRPARERREARDRARKKKKASEARPEEPVLLIPDSDEEPLPARRKAD